MNIGEKAVELHGSGLNCAQSVLIACEEYTGIDYDLAVGIANGFGGGVRCGEICGAASGGVMAVGACKKLRGCENPREQMSERAKLFCEKFNQRFEGIRCADIKGVKYTCNEMIEFAAKLAEETISEI